MILYMQHCISVTKNTITETKNYQCTKFLKFIKLYIAKTNNKKIILMFITSKCETRNQPTTCDFLSSWLSILRFFRQPHHSTFLSQTRAASCTFLVIHNFPIQIRFQWKYYGSIYIMEKTLYNVLCRLPTQG